MPTKAERRVSLPAGLVPLLTQQALETYYDVSESTVLQWIEAGMPVEPMKSATVASDTPQRRHRRFDLDAVKAWHAEHMPTAA